MIRMPLMGQRDQGIHVKQPPHGKSSKRVLILSEVTDSDSLRALVTRSPVCGSVTYSLTKRRRCSGVKITESPWISHLSLAPGAKCSLLRTRRGKTTCPLLERVVKVMRKWLADRSGRVKSDDHTLVVLESD